MDILCHSARSPAAAFQFLCFEKKRKIKKRSNCLALNYSFDVFIFYLCLFIFRGFKGGKCGTSESDDPNFTPNYKESIKVTM